MTKLKHLQNTILTITKYIDELCEEHGINYFLLGGSAIGAVRHKGFIPWDDDLDIVMDDENYKKFLAVCHNYLDKDHYYLQEEFKDWPDAYSKLKLRGTKFQEPSGYVNETGEEGIFVDIFKMENAPSSSIGRLWQYICAKYYLCYCQLMRGFDNASWVKRLMMFCANPLRIGFLRKAFFHEIVKYNKRDTEYRLFWAGRYRYHASFYHKSIFERSIKVPFEDTSLPVPAKYDEWLTQIFGNYMVLPPVEKQVGMHLMDVDFGEY